MMLVLTLAGVGRGVAAISDGAGSPLGFASSICHSASGEAPEGPHPPGPARHDCCDQGTCCAPALPPFTIGFFEPASVGPVVRHVRAPVGALSVARLRTPRLAQGPPAA